MTILKFMLSSVLVGKVGVYLLKDLGLAQLAVKPTVLGANILGGLIFGVGWGLLGIAREPPPGPWGKAVGTPFGVWRGCSWARPSMPRHTPSSKRPS
jgi:hypothetical protein